jgi:hypothetical protein
MGCPSDTPGANKKSDDTAASSASPKQIIGGNKAKVGTWSYPLDSSFNDFILGSPDYVKEMLRKFENYLFSLEGDLGSMHLLNNQDNELLTVFLCKNKENDWIPYLMRLERFNPDKIPSGQKPVRQKDMNWRSGNKLNITYTESFFMSLMTEQPLTTWEKGDTIYYTHQGQPKDASKSTKRFQPGDYQGTYKFVNGSLCWCEFGVKPEILQGK